MVDAPRELAPAVGFDASASFSLVLSASVAGLASPNRRVGAAAALAPVVAVVVLGAVVAVLVVAG